ncbi:hypothetical protein [Streptomyces niveiscabiei]|uniref:hypothetical protein n=1 Tax=Streptomyces niveiscabiei TaxID=164115 RepID=UPI0029CA2624|nr:hypothetical protein [Streptomyces niveiscabiei]
MLAGALEEVLEERAAAGGDHADDTGPEDRAVHAEGRGEFRGEHRGQRASGDLRNTEIGPFAHAGTEPSFPLLDQQLIDYPRKKVTS